MHETLAVAGSGTIATGLASVAAAHGDVVLWARSDASAQRALRALAKHREKLPQVCGDPARVRVVTELEALAEASFIVEAVVEDVGCKAAVLSRLAAMTSEQAIVATTTSSLSIAELAQQSGTPERLVGLHVFNPVPRMELIELAFAPQTRSDVRDRARALCATLGKTAVEVPDIPGFVVNRLLFPYLFDAVALMDGAGLSATEIDQAMTLGAGMPMGPLALLDFVGLDVARAIGETIGAEVPAPLLTLVDEGALGRKSGRGFYDYG